MFFKESEKKIEIQSQLHRGVKYRFIYSWPAVGHPGRQAQALEKETALLKIRGDQLHKQVKNL